MRWLRLLPRMCWPWPGPSRSSMVDLDEPWHHHLASPRMQARLGSGRKLRAYRLSPSSRPERIQGNSPWDRSLNLLSRGPDRCRSGPIDQNDGDDEYSLQAATAAIVQARGQHDLLRYLRTHTLCSITKSVSLRTYSSWILKLPW